MIHNNVQEQEARILMIIIMQKKKKSAAVYIHFYARDVCECAYP